jgi:hypothetical protein
MPYIFLKVVMRQCRRQRSGCARNIRNVRSIQIDSTIRRAPCNCLSIAVQCSRHFVDASLVGTASRFD